MLSLSYWLTSLALAAVAVCWAYVLVQPGMLLAPAQAWVRGWYRQVTRRPNVVPFDSPAAGQLDYGQEIDAAWWWKPLWGCHLCVAGQAGFWGYLLLFWHSYSLLAHLGFAAFTILFAALLRGVYAWTQNQ